MSDMLHYIIKILKLLVTVCFIAHWMACIYFFVAKEEIDNSTNSWLFKFKYVDSTISEKYIASLYWAITTMLTVGYGDIHPCSSNEKICCMACMLVSCVVFAYIVGSIGEIVRSSSEVAENLRDKMVSVNEFLKYKKIPKEFRIKIKGYLQYVLEEKSQMPVKESDLMELLNAPLREELTIYFHGCKLQTCPVFDNFTIDFMSYLTFFLNIENFSVGDTIFEEDEESQKLYFITKGRVLIFTKLPIAALAELQSDKYFGEIGFFGYTNRTASAQSLAFTQVLTLSREGLEKVSKSFPSSKSKLNEIKDQIGQGELQAINVECYYCKKKGHIASLCPEAQKYLPQFNTFFKYELKIIRKKIQSFKKMDRDIKNIRKKNYKKKESQNKDKSQPEIDIAKQIKENLLNPDKLAENIEEASSTKGQQMWMQYMQSKRPKIVDSASSSVMEGFQRMNLESNIDKSHI